LGKEKIPGPSVNRTSFKKRGNSLLREFPLSNAANRVNENLLLAGERKQRNIPAALNRNRNFPLVPRAIARNPAGKDLTALRNEEPERFEVLIVDERRLVDAEPAYLFSYLETSPLVRAFSVPGVPAA
jgi:hypothetical protein